MSEVSQSRLSKAAVVAFVLGASALILSLVTALPALFVGIHAIRAINRADGRLHGRRLAIAGLILGVFFTLVAGFGVCALVLLLVQEKNHVVVCANNLRQIGQAIEGYRLRNDDRFPPGTIPNAALPPDRRLSWEAALMPYLKPTGLTGKKWEKLTEALDDKEAWDAAANAGLRKNVAPFLCPVFARDLTPEQVGSTSYVGLAGVGREAAVLPLDDKNAGFFGYDRLLHPADITASLSALMVVAETRRENGPWAAGGTPTVRGVESDCTHYIGTDAPFGGLHRKGANVLWADGSVRLVTERVEPEIFRLETRILRP